MAPHILIIKTGTTEPKVVARFGDYDEWFARVLEGAGAQCTCVDAFAGQPLPDPRAFDGVLITGSPLSVRDDAPWMPILGRWIFDTAQSHPVLAVCFGHQLVGEAMGGTVGRNPNGREAGSVPVQLTAEGQADPLFAGLPPTLWVQATHSDVLTTPPTTPGMTVLAHNANTSIQAFAWGANLRAVQFHPELPEGAMAGLLRERLWPGYVRPTPHGPQVLRNWLTGWFPTPR